MINNAKRLALAAVIAACTFSISDISQQSFALTNAGNITTLNTALTENFDTLATGGTTNAWADNSTLPGWYAQFELQTANPTVYIANAGGTTNGAIYSYGTGTTTERALGSQSSGTPGTVYFGVKLTNNTGSTITSLDVSFVAEQWRQGGNTAPQTLGFQYRVAPAGTVTDVNTPSTGWTAFNSLDAVTPVVGTSTTAAALDGNNPLNQVPKSATIALNAANGQEIWLRWFDVNDSGNDHGMGIDQFSVIPHGSSGGGDSAPTVTMTAPTPVTNVSVTSPVTLTFSEPVDAVAGAMTIQCGSTPVFTSTVFSGTTVTLTPPNPFPYSTSCTVTVDKNKVTDQDNNDPPDTMDAPATFTFTTAAAPERLFASSPQANAPGLAVDSNILINFNRSVTAPATAFAVSCASSIGVSGSPGTSITIDPAANLPFNSDCTVTADASKIFAAQAPTQMESNFVFTFHTASKPVATNVMINEIDADTPGDDRAEFIELYGPPNTDLDGLVVVLYNGTSPFTPNPFEHQSYAAFDLDGMKTDGNGYFVLGNPGVPGAGLTFDPGANGLLQNGMDAVALYVGNGSDFPNGTPAAGALPTTGLVDAIVYETDDGDDAFLKALLNVNQPQVNENGGGDSQHQSVGRCDNGAGGMRSTSTYVPATPTPGAANSCVPRPPSDVVISQIYGGGGNANATYQNDYVQLYNRGQAAVDIGGWSLQYAAATGTSWTNKQPLGGVIQPGEYYLVGLGSGGATGAALADPDGTPAGTTPSRVPNISGAINMSASNGKIALVSSGISLVGACPLFNPNLRDFVGYGTTATCGEGNTKAPVMSNTSADFRKVIGGPINDNDNNAADFISAGPNPYRTAPIQELPPFVFTTDPPAGGSNVPRDPTIVVSFTEPVSVDPGWYNVSCDSGVHNSASVDGNGPFKDITLNDRLTPGEHCTVTIDHTKVHDSDTNDPTPFYDLLPEDVSWSFTVATGTAPPYPASVHLTFGNPSGAIADLGSPNNYLMLKPEFSLSYDRDLGRPNWVSWHLSNEWTGTLTRVDTFRADPAIPPPSNPPGINDWYRVESFDFAGSGFDRGHMTPNADRDKETSVPINQATFLMTNMVAQAPDNNQGPWAAFEGYLRTLTDGGTNEAYIISGPSGVGGTGSNGGVTNTIANGHVTVPSATWKVALILPKGDNDLSRVNCSTRTIAVLMPNTQGIRNDPWDSFLTNVDAIEDLTGYNFFTNLSSQVQQCIESGVNGDNPPLDSDAPAIACDAPDGLWHGDNVTLSCHAVDAASGLAHPSDASFTLMTSVVSGSESANALTDTRTVCDKAGNCFTAGPIGGNRIDRIPPVVACAAADGAWHNGDVTIACSASDTGAGISAADAAFGLSTSVAPGTVDANASTGTRVVCDAAGNCVTAGPIADNKVDRTAPIVTCATPDGVWHNTNVTLTCTTTDTGSGVSAADASFTLATSVAAGFESADAATGSVAVCDAAGNCVTAGPISGNMIDRKAPVVNCALADGAWHNTNVTIACSASDAGVGVAADASFGLSTSVTPGTADANASTGSRLACDALNNCGTAGPVGGNKIDRIAPAVTLAAPGNGSIYQLNRSVTAQFACSDSDSGVNTCTGTAASGAAIDTASTGTKTFTVNATDAAGNTTSSSVTYSVRSNAISISNVPTSLMLREDSFVPTFNYAGDGATSVTSLTLKECTVENGAVVFQKKGTCTIVAHATATATFDAADGPQQSFQIDPHKLRNR